MEQFSTSRRPPAVAGNKSISTTLLRCIFCCDRELTATRIWSGWLDLKCSDGRNHDRGALPPVRSLYLTLACTRCINGWMAELDGLAEQILGPRLDGTPSLATGSQMRALAGWLCLLAIKLTTANESCIIPPSNRSHICHTKRPPQNWGNFVARLVDARASRSYWQHAFRVEFSGNPTAGYWWGRTLASHKSQMISICVGSLFFHSFSSPSLITLHDFVAAARREGLTRVWPPARRFGLLPHKETRLPPTLTLTEQEARLVGERFAAQLRTRLRSSSTFSA